MSNARYRYVSCRFCNIEWERSVSPGSPCPHCGRLLTLGTLRTQDRLTRRYTAKTKGRQA